MKPTKYKGIYYRTLKDGTISFNIRPKIAGHRTWRKAGDTITEAKELLKDYRRMKRLEGFGMAIPRRIRLDALLKLYRKDYIKRRGDEVSNLPRVKSILRRISRTFGNVYVDDLTALDIDLAALPRPDINYLRTILRHAKRWGFIIAVPDFIMPPTAMGLKRTLSTAELVSAIEQAGPDHADAIRLSIALGGARLGELCKITQDNTDFEQGTVTLTKRKAGIPKVFALVSTAATILRRRFIANGGVAFTQSANRLSRKFHYEREKMKGIKSWRFHDLRHTEATCLRDAGVPETLVKEILGHASLKTTERYIHSTLAQEREALEALECTLREKRVF